MLKQFEIIVEKHGDGYVAYPLGLKGVVVRQGGTYEEALADCEIGDQIPRGDLRPRGNREYSARPGGFRSRSGRVRVMGGFPADAPVEKVISAFELLGFHLVRRGNHIALCAKTPAGPERP